MHLGTTYIVRIGRRYAAIHHHMGRYVTTVSKAAALRTRATYRVMHTDDPHAAVAHFVKFGMFTFDSIAALRTAYAGENLERRPDLDVR